MTNLIKCPSCHHEFEPNEIIREELEKELRGKMLDWQKKKQTELEESFSEMQKIRNGELKKETLSGFLDEL